MVERQTTHIVLVLQMDGGAIDMSAIVDTIPILTN